MKITIEELNRATLARQLLLAREELSVPEATRRIVAIQAQEPASPYIALWNRLIDFDAAELDTAFAEQKLVKATLLRFTLHAVHLDDHAAIYAAMRPSFPIGSGKARLLESGLTHDQVVEIVPEMLKFIAEPRSTAEVEAWITEQHGIPPKGVWWVIRAFAPLLHSPTGGPWSFKHRPAYVAAPGHLELQPAAAVETLVRRYLEGFGPASLADIAQFASITRTRVRAALDSLGDQLLVLDGPDGKPLYDVPDAPRPDGDTPAPARLMAMWDSTLLAYADRSRIVPAKYKTAVTRTNGDVLPTLLVNGLVAGVWRPTPDGIEATAFEPLTASTWKALTTEAEPLARFLTDREPTTYSRYNHWWPKLPGVETRLLD